MKLDHRIVLNVLTALSLLLCVAMLPFWYLSLSPPEEILYLGGTRPWGQFSLWKGYLHFAWAPASAAWAYYVPFWLLFFVSISLPLGRNLVARWKQFANRHRATRAASGLCLECGYDLRATPGRCPECGAVVGGSAGP